MCQDAYFNIDKNKPNVLYCSRTNNYLDMDIKKKLEKFKYALRSHNMSEREKEAYIELETHLLQSETMPFKELLARAKKIKPLVRVDGDHNGVLGFRKKCYDFADSDTLCFCKPCDIRSRSYLYDFNASSVVMTKGKPFAVPKHQKVGEFTCYHDAGAFYGCLMPSVDEVLQQMPAEIDWHTVDAFELSFPSLNFCDVYDDLLDRHISTVILYRFDNGLPKRIKAQPIVYNGQRYF